MAIFHCSIQMIGRSSGRSATAASAYRSGTVVKDAETGITHDYTAKRGVVYTEVILCENAPASYQDRETLWNEVHKVEKRSDAQLAREIEVALPREFSREQQICTLKKYVQDNFISVGMCADLAIHDKGDGNPHAHIMLTTREIKPDGKWAAKQKTTYKLDDQGERIPVIDPATGQQKIGARNRKEWERTTVPVNDWNDQSKAETWRAAWAEECNKMLSSEKKIDHRSYERQGIDQIPTIHEGYTARKIQANYEAGKTSEPSERVMMNHEIREKNSLLQKIAQKIKELVQAFSHINLQIGTIKAKMGASKVPNTAQLLEAYRDMKNKEKDVLQREKYIVRERPINQDLIDRPQKLRECIENLAAAHRVRKECEERIRTEYPPKPEKPKGILVTKKKQEQYQLDLNAWNTMVEPLVLLARQNHAIVETEFEELKKHLKPYEMQVGYDGIGRYDDSKRMINPYFMTDQDVSQLESCVEQLITKPHDGYQAIADLEQRLSDRLNELNAARNDFKASQSRFIDIAKHFPSEVVDKAKEAVNAEFSSDPSPSVEQTQQKAREGTWADVSVKIAQERAKEQRNHQETQPKKQKQQGHEWSR